MEIDLLYVPDCPSRILARDALEQAMARTGRTAVVRERVVGSVEEAERLGMWGSPTILINGRDAFPGGHGRAAWSCRLDVPTVSQLAEALMT
ncbi:MAG TPA: thioredoxin family protein [Acidimicrobiia bacterium]|nr:thioredoxin family protein [Acidimicrobiia bacterium]